ncbi:MAG: HD domain-containing protein, partial [Planctomycetes bacterium]|nr:HD domain-containing protein [Planctomycetota bacterium]
GIYDVLVPKSYLEKDQPDPEPSVGAVESAEQVDFELMEKIDLLITAGQLHVENNGPRFRDDVVVHQLDPYNLEGRQSFINLHRRSVEELEEMMNDASNGKRVDGTRLLDMAGSFLRFFFHDTDSVLSVTSEVTQEKSIALHCSQQAILGMAIGIEMGLNEQNVKTIGLCGLLHDWGMLRVPTHIREANRALSFIEFLEVKKHPQYTLEFLQNVDGVPDLVGLVCFQIHEKPNGTGYPLGRSADTIHLFAKILAVADSYLAMISPRPHRPAVMPYAAMECLLRTASQKTLDAEVVRTLLQALSLFPVGSYITLSDNSSARVMRRHSESYMTPVVQVIQDYRGCRLDLTDEKSIIDLAVSELSIKESAVTPGREEIGLSPAVMDQPRL